MEFGEMIDALIWLDEHFHMIRPLPDTMPTIDYILEKARAAVLRCAQCLKPLTAEPSGACPAGLVTGSMRSCSLPSSSLSSCQCDGMHVQGSIHPQTVYCGLCFCDLLHSFSDVPVSPAATGTASKD
eukprot:GHUV01049515.1.p1 GENE.GHUV01049515.1~~GHUV01049515.1.p1  ORF type:complete len:127 (+),score=11.60 GHUV01049515.1:264-644(+)